MKFDMTAEEMAEVNTGGGTSFFRYLKDGDNEFRIAQEPSEWVRYLEHYNPNGYPFPCSRQPDCNGCTSDNVKMQGVSKRVAFNVIEGEYNNVWKIPVTVADKLENRHQRIGTITDRTYRITRLKTGSGDKARYDFDVEGMDKVDSPIDTTKFHDIQKMLQEAWDEAWGTSSKVQATVSNAAQAQSETDLRAKIEANREAVTRQLQPADPPSEPEEQVVNAADLRALDLWDLAALAVKEGFGKPPTTVTTPDEMVDWMISVQTQSV
jgi:hypothetical protein